MYLHMYLRKYLQLKTWSGFFSHKFEGTQRWLPADSVPFTCNLCVLNDGYMYSTMVTSHFNLSAPSL